MSHPHPKHAEHADHAQHPEHNIPRHQNERYPGSPDQALETAVAATQTHEARGEVKAPEAALLPQTDTPLVPTETKNPILKVPPQSVVAESVATLAPNETKDVRVRAEEALAGLLRKELPKELCQGLELDVLPVVGYGTNGIKLCFHGEQVTTKAPMLNEKLIGNGQGLLTQHSVLGKFFQNKDQLPTIEATNNNMYHIVIPMTVELYQQTLAELAGDAPAKASPQPQAEQVLESAIAPVAEEAQKKDTPNEQHVPSNVIQKPVAALEKAVNDNDRAPEGLAK